MNFLIFPFSLLYRAGCQLKNLLYHWKILNPKKAPLPIISIGNITFGGSEKTPLVMNVISFLLEQGYKPALLSRGYKGKWEKKGDTLSDGRSILGSWQDSGDEPFMIAQNIPQAGIFIGKNRLSSSQKAAEFGFNVGVLDDGFQHRTLQRDLDIVLYDLSQKTALREPLSSLKRAHLLLVKKKGKSKRKKAIKKNFSKKAFFEYSVISRGFFKLGEKEEKVSAERIRRKKVIAFCGIARPGRFYSLLQEEGIYPKFFLKFPDHHPYPQSSLEKILKYFFKAEAEVLIMTEKDAVKVVDKINPRKIPAYYIKIDLDVEKEFYPAVLSVIQNID